MYNLPPEITSRQKNFCADASVMSQTQKRVEPT